VSEYVKRRLNDGRAADLFFWRDSQGLEIDLMYETASGLQAVEIKSGETFASDWPKGAHSWLKLAQTANPQPKIIYGGSGNFERQECRVLGWQEFLLNKNF
jgi:uncharacterized protein